MYPYTISRTRSDRVQVEVDHAQAATPLGIPNGSVSHYKFTNPGNSDSACIFAIRWEELPIK